MEVTDVWITPQAQAAAWDTELLDGKTYTWQTPHCMHVQAQVCGYGKSCFPMASHSQIGNYWHFCVGHKATNDFYTQNALEIAWAVTDRSALLILPHSVLNQQKYKWLHSIFFIFPYCKFLEGFMVFWWAWEIVISHLLSLMLGSRLFNVKSSYELQRAAN